MSTNNPWLTPYQRSFDSIKSKLVSSLKTNVPEITDFSEGNIFIILISIFAAIAEVLHYYIDNMARETFFYTARRYSSLYKHAKLVDYHIKAANPASSNIYVSTKDGTPLAADTSDPSYNGIHLLASDNLEFTDVNGNIWVLSRDVFWENGTYSAILPVSQKEPISEGNYVTVGQITDPNSVIYLGEIPDGKQYVEGSMTLKIQYDGTSEDWELVDTFAYSGPEDKVYKVELDNQLKPYIVFGDGLFGKKPNLNGTLIAKYWITLGSNGNIAENSFNQLPVEITELTSNISIKYSSAAGGGTDYEDFDMIKAHLPLSVKTMGVAITKEDYESVIMSIPGVNKAYVNYICGKTIEAYITPYGSAEASEELVSKVSDEISSSKVITVDVAVKSTKEALVFMGADIWGKKSYRYNDIYNLVNETLVDSYSVNNSTPNRPIRLSDIYALIDNLSFVDYLKLSFINIVSKPSTIDGTGKYDNLVSVIYLEVVSVSNEITTPYLSYTLSLLKVSGMGDTVFYSIKNANTGDVVVNNDGLSYSEFGKTYTFTDTSSVYGLTIKFKLALQQGPVTVDQGILPITDGISLDFSQNVNRLIEVLPINYNIPVIKSSTLTLNIHEQV